MLALTIFITYSVLVTLAIPIQRATAVYNVHPSGVPNLCLATTQTPANGIVLWNIPCERPAGSDKAYLDFAFEPTVPGIVQLTGTQFCIDAGLAFNELKLWTCYPSVPQQTWIYTDTNHLALWNQTTCASYNGGGCGLGGCAPGTVKCGLDENQQNKVQTWTLSAPGVIPPPPPPPLPPATGTELKWNGQCLGLTIRGASDGTIVNMGPCLAITDHFKGTQLWVVLPKGTDGLIRLDGTSQCLDAGDPPLVTGRILKTWTCYPGSKQQTWFHTSDDHLAVTGDVQCLDVKKEDTPNILGNVQTWQCSGGDPQQIFTVLS